MRCNTTTEDIMKLLRTLRESGINVCEYMLTNEHDPNNVPDNYWFMQEKVISENVVGGKTYQAKGWAIGRRDDSADSKLRHKVCWIINEIDLDVVYEKLYSMIIGIVQYRQSIEKHLRAMNIIG